MLYLITPTLEVHWTDLPARTTLEVAAEHGSDLAKLDWQPALSQPFTPDLLRLALRHGHACSRGIVLSATDAVVLNEGDLVRSALSNFQAATTNLPAWAQLTDEHNRAITESSSQAASEFDAELAQLLAAPPKPELEELWSRLGGAPLHGVELPHA